MNDPLMTYHTTKDIGAVYQHLEALIATDPMASQNMSLIRNTAAFFYILEKNGEHLTEWPKDRYSMSIEEAQEALARGEMLKSAGTAVFMVVQEIVRRWFDSITTDEAVTGMRQQLQDSWAIAPMGLQDLSQEQKDAGAQQVAESMLAPHPGTILGLPEFDTPKCNDMCYALWGATGDARYLTRVIAAVNQPEDPATMVGLVPITGAWSLGSLRQQYPAIKDVVDGVPGANAKILVLLEKRGGILT